MRFSLLSSSVALLSMVTAAALSAPAEESHEGHDHSRESRTPQRQKRPSAINPATPREKALQDRIDRAIVALSQQADTAWHKGDYEGLAFANRMITVLDPQDILAWSDLGWILWAGLNNEKEAEKVLRAGVAANPNRHDLYYDLGFYLYRRKRFHEAAAVLHKGTRFKDADAVTWNVYAHALEKMGRPEQAAEVWREEKKRFPDAPHPDVNLARMKRKGLIK